MSMISMGAHNQRGQVLTQAYIARSFDHALDTDAIEVL